jgi:site-specific DNA-methyltransferase (adenine-specific)
MFMEHAEWFSAGGWHFSQDLVWEKHNGSSFHADRFRRVHESICHFYRGPWGDLKFYVPTTPDATAKTVRRKQRPAHMGNIDYHASMHGKAEHPTQKPVGILEPLIHYGGFGDATVIVPFAGVGSELVAAKKMGHCAIGMEIDERFCEAAAKRLSQEVLDFGVNS